jgi:hypothetical protein
MSATLPQAPIIERDDKIDLPPAHRDVGKDHGRFIARGDKRSDALKAFTFRRVLNRPADVDVDAHV